MPIGWHILQFGVQNCCGSGQLAFFADFFYKYKEILQRKGTATPLADASEYSYAILQCSVFLVQKMSKNIKKQSKNPKLAQLFKSLFFISTD